MISMTLEKSELKFRDRFRWNTVARRWAMETAEVVTRAVRDAAPVGKREGENHNGQLRDSIDHKVVVGASTATVEIYSRVPYVGYVIRGTSPHPIQPVNATRLHWISGGNHVYRSLVQHPGTKANPFAENATRALATTTNRRLAEAVKTSLEV